MSDYSVSTTLYDDVISDTGQMPTYTITNTPTTYTSVYASPTTVSVNTVSGYNLEADSQRKNSNNETCSLIPKIKTTFSDPETLYYRYSSYTDFSVAY